MKARLAKKLAHTPFNRLAPYWTNNFVYSDRRDARFEKALAMWNKREQRKYKQQKAQKNTKPFTLAYVYQSNSSQPS